jgi:hypothetical protein
MTHHPSAGATEMPRLDRPSLTTRHCTCLYARCMCSCTIWRSKPNKDATLPDYLSSFPTAKPHGQFHWGSDAAAVLSVSEDAQYWRNTESIRIDCNDLKFDGSVILTHTPSTGRSVPCTSSSHYTVCCTETSGCETRFCPRSQAPIAT